MKISITRRVNILYLILSVFILSSCSEEGVSSNKIVEEEEIASVDPYFVDEIEAYHLGSIIKQSYSETKSQTEEILYKEIKEIMPVPDEDGKNVFYIINYEEGGFIILSADKRTNPILAFSEDSHLPLNQHEIPGGLIDWFAQEQEYITYIRNNPDSLVVEQRPLTKGGDYCEFQALAAFIGAGASAAYNEDVCELPHCPGEYYEAGPLLTTRWGQDQGYNNMAPPMACAQTLNGRAWAGCVATATAQIMKYHEYPKAAYNWKSMPLTFGSDEISRLMYNIGMAIGMKYGCDGSAAKLDRVPEILKNMYGYTSATYADFNLDVVKSEIFNNKRPVILAGGRKSGWWIFASYNDGHAWVCDGYKYGFAYSADCSTGWGNTYLHMNWGWSSKTLNGWFSYSDWSVNGDSYNYQKKMITVRP